MLLVLLYDYYIKILIWKQLSLLPLEYMLNKYIEKPKYNFLGRLIWNNFYTMIDKVVYCADGV